MNILILGGGGREHALAWAVRQNPKCGRLIVAPGNGGIGALAECVALDITDGAAVVAFCRQNAIDFLIIGPEAPLVAGVADAARAAGILTFGPSAAAARLESSKAFTKEICAACGAPTARHARFTTREPAIAHVRRIGAPIVIKADGLALGKGVVVARTEAEAIDAVDAMLGGRFGSAGTEILIEEFMPGEEASFFVLTDGQDAVPIGSARDYKRALDGDDGPNTGGMGAFSPAPDFDDNLTAQVMDEIIRPTIRELAARGTPYMGVLYAGLMILDGRARLVEYNCRFGDPECQVLMMRLGAQALDLMLAAAEGRLADARANWAEDHALTVVMTADGYPGPYERGSEIRGLAAIPEDSHHMIFHAGTRREGERTIATGGRVLNVTARGPSLAAARAAAYDMVGRIDWPEGRCRSDIGLVNKAGAAPAHDTTEPEIAARAPARDHAPS